MAVASSRSQLKSDEQQVKLKELVQEKEKLHNLRNKWEESFLAFLNKNYQPNPQVIEYVRQHPEIWQVLYAVPEQIIAHLGLPVSWQLELFPDPDFPTEKQLLLHVFTDLAVDVADEKLATFYETWWFENTVNIATKIGFVIDFR
jgi:hypothetical protein